MTKGQIFMLIFQLSVIVIQFICLFFIEYWNRKTDELLKQADKTNAESIRLLEEGEKFRIKALENLGKAKENLIFAQNNIPAQLKKES